MHRKRDVHRRLPAGAGSGWDEAGVLEREQRGADRRGAGWEELAEGAADQQADELGLGRVGSGDTRNRAVAHDRDPIGDAGDFLQPVRDVDHADAARPEVVDDREEMFGLGRGQGGGRLVEDEDARLGGERLGDGDQLALAEAQAADAEAWVEIDAGAVEQRARAAGHGAVVERAPAGHALLAEEEVDGDVEAGDEVELLRGS